MPGYKTHLIGGIGAGTVVALLLGIIKTPLSLTSLSLYVGCSLLGSIFPDIDVVSKMQRLFFVVATAVLIFSLLTNRITCFLATGFLILLVTFLRHRTLTHQVSFLICMPLFLIGSCVYVYKIPAQFSFNCAFFFIAGCLSHVFLDRSLTRLKRLFK